MGNGGIPETKAAEGGADYSPQSSAEVKEKVELYLYLPFPCGPVLGCTLILSFFKVW